MPDYFGTRQWFALLADTCLGARETAVVHRITDGGGQVVDIPLKRAAYRGGRLAGFELQSLANYYSSVYCPIGLSASADPATALSTWAKALVRQRPTPHRVLLRALDEADGTLQVVESALQDVGLRLERFPDFGNWYLPCRDLSFEGYWQQRSSRLRNTVRRKHKALSGRHAVEFLRLDRPEQAEQATAAYQFVNAEAWQPDEPFPSFLPELIRRGLAEGTVAVWLLQVDGAPVAAQIWTMAGVRATLFKLAYSTRWKDVSPGTLLTYEAVRSAVESRAFDEIDFGRGDDAYKSEWMTQRRQRWGVAAYNGRTVAGNLLAFRNLFPQYVKGIRQSIVR